MIQSLDVLLTELTGSVSAGSIEVASRIGKTVGVDDIMNNFKSIISDNEDFIAFKLKRKSPEFKEFFPLGKTEYTNVNKSNFETLAARFISVSNKYETLLGVNLSTTVQAVLDLFIATRKGQLQNIGGVKAKSRDVGQIRQSLEKQLQKTLFKLLDIYADNLQTVLDFFEVSLLMPHKKPVKAATGA